jgi:OFA family oxalate/formate antiporter-like MFS transporter
MATSDNTKAELLANWQILAVAFLLVFFSFGVPNFSLPFMYKPAMDEFGWTNTQVNLLSTAKFLIGAIAALGMGILIDKIGGKLAVLIGALAGGCAMALFLLATNLPVYYLAGALLGVSASSIVSAMKVVVSRLFEINAGLALGIVLGATSMGQTLMPFVWTPLLEAGWNWRVIAGMLSLGSLLISAPMWLFFMSRAGATQDVINSSTQRAPGAPTMWDHAKEVSKERGFWFIMLSIFLVSAVDQAMTQNTVTYLRNDKGFNLGEILWYSSYTGILAVVAKPVAGWVYDHYSIAGIRFFYFLLALSVLLALPVSGGLTLFLFVTVLGVAHGGLIVEAPVLTKHYLGPRNLGMTIGIISVAVNLGFAAGPPALGALVDHYGSFRNGFIVYTVVALIGFALMLPIRPRFWTPPSKRTKQEQEVGAVSGRPATV